MSTGRRRLRPSQMRGSTSARIRPLGRAAASAVARASQSWSGRRPGHKAPAPLGVPDRAEASTPARARPRRRRPGQDVTGQMGQGGVRGQTEQAPAGSLGGDEHARITPHCRFEDLDGGAAGSAPGPSGLREPRRGPTRRAARTRSHRACSPARKRGARSSWSKSRKATSPASSTRWRTASVPMRTGTSGDVGGGGVHHGHARSRQQGGQLLPEPGHPGAEHLHPRRPTPGTHPGPDLAPQTPHTGEVLVVAVTQRTVTTLAAGQFEAGVAGQEPGPAPAVQHAHHPVAGLHGVARASTNREEKRPRPGGSRGGRRLPGPASRPLGGPGGHATGAGPRVQGWSGGTRTTRARASRGTHPYPRGSRGTPPYPRAQRSASQVPGVPGRRSFLLQGLDPSSRTTTPQGRGLGPAGGPSAHRPRTAAGRGPGPGPVPPAGRRPRSGPPGARLPARRPARRRPLRVRVDHKRRSGGRRRRAGRHQRGDVGGRRPADDGYRSAPTSAAGAEARDRPRGRPAGDGEAARARGPAGSRPRGRRSAGGAGGDRRSARPPRR